MLTFVPVIIPDFFCTMKRKFLFSFLGACLLAACADTARQPAGDMAVIDVAVAMDNLAPLKLSELGSTVRYVPLQTTDSCLVGNKPSLTVAGDYILVQSGEEPGTIELEATAKGVKSGQIQIQTRQADSSRGSSHLCVLPVVNAGK